jgi:hypothetical protein
MEKLEISERSGRLITFSMKKVPMSIYEVWMSDGNEFKKIAEQTETELIYTITSNECKFEFKVRAKKEAQFGFSYGKFSDVLTLETEPATMENL